MSRKRTDFLLTFEAAYRNQVYQPPEKSGYSFTCATGAPLYFSVVSNETQMSAVRL
jgi:hypothetical protein